MSESLKFLLKKEKFWAAFMNPATNLEFSQQIKIITIEHLKKKFIYM